MMKVNVGQLKTNLSSETIASLEKEGITVIPAKELKGTWVPTPGKTGDNLNISNTVVAMRLERNW